MRHMASVETEIGTGAIEYLVVENGVDVGQKIDVLNGTVGSMADTFGHETVAVARGVGVFEMYPYKTQTVEVSLHPKPRTVGLNRGRDGGVGSNRLPIRHHLQGIEMIGLADDFAAFINKGKIGEIMEVDGEFQGVVIHAIRYDDGGISDDVTQKRSRIGRGEIGGVFGKMYISVLARFYMAFHHNQIGSGWKINRDVLFAA